MCRNKKQPIIFLVSTFTLLSNWSSAQTNQITIRFIGNCGLALTDGTTNLYIDFPYKSGAHHYMEYDTSELDSVKEQAIFLFTHKHSDHYSSRLLKKINGKKYGPWNIPELTKMEESIPDFRIEAFRTPHKVYGISFKHYSYLITWHGKKIYLSGDTENPDTIAIQKELDWAFVPAWLFRSAYEKGIKLGEISEMFAVYHIGPRDHITNDGNPKIKLLDKQGEVIGIDW